MSDRNSDPTSGRERSSARASDRHGCTGGLQPVVIAVPDAIRQLRGRILVRRLSRLARLALRRAVVGRACPTGPWVQDAQGVPQPTDGLFWSVSHKPAYVAGVAAPHPVGIDLEPLLPRSPKLYAKIASPAEWQLRREAKEIFFYRLWTAKEAVLKAEGVGLRGLSRCRVIAVHDDRELSVTFEDRQWPVRQFRFDGHLASVTPFRGTVQWVVSALRPPRREGAESRLRGKSSRSSGAVCDPP